MPRASVRVNSSIDIFLWSGILHPTRKEGPMRTETVIVTPEQAAQWLENSEKNRPHSPPER